jgi:hypothetical protein
MHITMLVVLFALFFNSATHAQAPDYRVLHLTSRILDKLPDAPYTRGALGDTDERELRAIEHAIAIVSAADQYREEWEDFVEIGGWTEFSPERDLPALIAALAFRESSFRSVVRLDDNTVLSNLPKGVTRADFGVMQVRAPSRPAKTCGVGESSDLHRLLNDIEYAYLVGACILTQRVAGYIQMYRSAAFTRLHVKERSNADLAFFGVMGPRKGTPAAKLARELMVVERYNWGGSDLYLSATHGSYARYLIHEFEFFRIPVQGDAS